MKIPKYLGGRRFYVACTQKEAFSSWSTLEEAIDCVKRAPEDYREAVTGVVEVYQSTTNFHILPDNLRGSK